MGLSEETWHRLTLRDMALSAEVVPSNSSRRAFVGVYPIKPQEDTFRVRYFEIDRDELDQYKKNDWAIEESNLRNQQDTIVTGKEALEVVLMNWLDDFTKLVQPVFTDYPL